MCGLVLQWFIIYNLLFTFSLILQLFTIYHSFAAWCTRKWRMPSTGASSVTSWWCITWRSVCDDDGDVCVISFNLFVQIFIKCIYRSEFLMFEKCSSPILSVCCSWNNQTPGPVQGVSHLSMKLSHLANIFCPTWTLHQLSSVKPEHWATSHHICLSPEYKTQCHVNIKHLRHVNMRSVTLVTWIYCSSRANTTLWLRCTLCSDQTKIQFIQRQVLEIKTFLFHPNMLSLSYCPLYLISHSYLHVFSRCCSILNISTFISR